MEWFGRAPVLHKLYPFRERRARPLSPNSEPIEERQSVSRGCRGPLRRSASSGQSPRRSLDRAVIGCGM